MLPESSRAAFTARLFFENLTRGTSNLGALDAAPADEIAIRYQCAGGPTDDRWGILQMVLCDNGVIPSVDSGTWVNQFAAVAVPAGDFPILKLFGNIDLYDNALNPTDTTRPFVCHGNYALLGIDTSTTHAQNWDVTFFRFHAAGLPGTELHWMYENRVPGFGLSTRVVTGDSHQLKVTDNFIRMVPEPPMPLAAGAGAAMLAFAKRRRSA